MHAEVVIVSFWYIQIDRTLNTPIIIVSTHNSISFVNWIHHVHWKQTREKKAKEKKKYLFEYNYSNRNYIKFAIRYAVKKITWKRECTQHTQKNQGEEDEEINHTAQEQRIKAENIHLFTVTMNHELFITTNILAQQNAKWRISCMP